MRGSSTCVRVRLYINRVVFVSNFIFVDAESVKTSRYLPLDTCRCRWHRTWWRSSSRFDLLFLLSIHTLSVYTGQCAMLGCRERTLVIDRLMHRSSSSDTVVCRATCGDELNVSAGASVQDFVYCSVETTINGLWCNSSSRSLMCAHWAGKHLNTNLLLILFCWLLSSVRSSVRLSAAAAAGVNYVLHCTKGTVVKRCANCAPAQHASALLL